MLGRRLRGPGRALVQGDTVWTFDDLAAQASGVSSRGGLCEGVFQGRLGSAAGFLRALHCQIL